MATRRGSVPIGVSETWRELQELLIKHLNSEYDDDDDEDGSVIAEYIQDMVEKEGMHDEVIRALHDVRQEIYMKKLRAKERAEWKKHREAGRAAAKEKREADKAAAKEKREADKAAAKRRQAEQKPEAKPKQHKIKQAKPAAQKKAMKARPFKHVMKAKRPLHMIV